MKRWFGTRLGPLLVPEEPEPAPANKLSDTPQWVIEGWVKIVEESIAGSPYRYTQVYVNDRPLSELLLSVSGYRQESPDQGTKGFGRLRLEAFPLPEPEQQESAWQRMFYVDYDGSHTEEVRAIDVSARYGTAPSTVYKIQRDRGNQPYIHKADWGGPTLFTNRADAAVEVARRQREHAINAETIAAEYDRLAQEWGKEEGTER